MSATTAGDAAMPVVEAPTGAIENGRAYAHRLEHDYAFECEAGSLGMCDTWREMVRCFEHLADWCSSALAAIAERDARIAELERCWGTGAVSVASYADAIASIEERDARITKLEADLREEQDRRRAMSNQWRTEVEALTARIGELTAQARHAEDVADAAKQRIADLENPSAPVACIGIEDGRILRQRLLAPGLPDGEHDLWCEPSPSYSAAVRIAELEAEGAKSERRAIMFGDIVAQYTMAMRAAYVAAERGDAADGMEWIANTLAGPGHLPGDADIALGAQALFDKEMAGLDEFRAAHPAPLDPHQPKEPA